VLVAVNYRLQGFVLAVAGKTNMLAVNYALHFYFVVIICIGDYDRLVRVPPKNRC
jgi:hypothetical protein